MFHFFYLLKVLLTDINYLVDRLKIVCEETILVKTSILKCEYNK